MGKRRYKKHKRMREDYASIQSAGKKRGLWGSIGSTLISGLAMLATGGAAAPAVAGMMAAGGSFAGGHIGNWLAGKTKLGGSGKLTGTKWYGSLGEELGSTIKENISAQAMKTGLKTTLTAAGGGVTSKLFGKGGATSATVPGATATKDTNALAKFFKGGDKGGQTGFKGLIDYEGSAMGNFFKKDLTQLQTGEGLVPTGQENMIGTGELSSGKGGVPDLDKMFAEELELPATEGFLDQDVYRAKIDQMESIAPRELRGKNQWDAYKSSIPRVQRYGSAAGSDEIILFPKPGSRDYEPRNNRYKNLFGDKK